MTRFYRSKRLKIKKNAMVNSLISEIEARWFDILLGISIPFCGFVVRQLWSQVILNQEKARCGFFVDGFWYSVHTNYKNNEIIEIFHMKQQRGQGVKILIQQFRKEKNASLQYTGIGILDGNYLSLIYYCKNKTIRQSGVMELERVERLGASDYFRGTYHEQSIERTENDVKPYPSNSYKLYRIEHPDRWFKWKIYFKQPAFSSFREAKGFVDKRDPSRKI